MSSASGRSCAQNHSAICLQKALITAGMTCKDWGMSGRIHSQWHCSAASQSLHTTHPSKKCHPLWSLQHSPNPLPFDHYSSNTQQSCQRQYPTSFSLCQSFLPSLWLFACPLVRRNQPVSPLWADMAACSPLCRPVATTKQAFQSYWGALALWHLESGYPAECYQEGNSD